MASVTLQNVRKVYDASVEAVSDFSLEIADGELVALVGPSGCGKSTTLRLIAGLEEPSDGRILIGGRVVNGVHPKDRDVAMVFQNYALYPHMRVSENMAFALRLRRLPRAEIERRVLQVARMLGIEELLDRRPWQLSGGQRQRVALGRAIVRQPKAFLFDEPLSNLDARLRVTTRAELKALHQRLATTTVYVTHDQEEAMTLGDRIVVMSRGRIQQAGPPLEVYERPANRFVASFIGTPPMNFLEGTLRLHGDAPLFTERHASPQGAAIPLPGAWRALAARHVGRPLVLGVRPQALCPVADGPLHLSIRVVEPLGDVMDVSGMLADTETALVARLPARAGLRPGDVLNLCPDPLRLHLFEPGEFGARLEPAEILA